MLVTLRTEAVKQIFEAFLLSDRAIGGRGDKYRQVVMLTRRDFSSFAVCAICGITEFIATEASAQGTQPTATPGVTRNILSQMDGPAPGYVTLLVDATIEPGE